jgi:hypothetical protein
LIQERFGVHSQKYYFQIGYFLKVCIHSYYLEIKMSGNRILIHIVKVQFNFGHTIYQGIARICCPFFYW